MAACYAGRGKVESVAVERVEAPGNRAAVVSVRVTTVVAVHRGAVFVSKRERLWLVDWERTVELHAGAAP
jgi:hypothetical protein